MDPLVDIALRPIRDEDQPFLRDLYASTRQDEMSAVDWSEAQKREFLAMQFHAQHVYYQEQFPDAEFSLVLRRGEPAGRLYLDRRDGEIRIIDIALVPACRGVGVGGAMMRRVLTEAGAAGKKVRIHVERSNPALRLYDRLGFRRIEDQGVYYLLEWSLDERSQKGLGES